MNQPRPTFVPDPDTLLPALGTTGSDPAALDTLVAHQRGNRLLLLRGLLDSVRTAPAGSLPEGAAERTLRDWRLLEAAERADPAAARRIVHYPLTGAWAERTLRALNRRDRTPAAADLPHLGALAAAAAARAGLRFTAEVPLTDGVLTLPTLGGHHVPKDQAATARVEGDGDRLLLRLAAPGDGGAYDDTVEVHRGHDGIWRSPAPGWRPLRALHSAHGRPVLIDDVDPYRDEERRTNPYGLDATDELTTDEHARWRAAWREAQPWLRLGDGSRAREVDALLDCFVPLAGGTGAQCSATRGEAFGALLSSTPRGGLELAATLVHELQHTKLLALSQLTVLHTADGTPRYWAPWRTDSRPFEGLFQGAFAHLALADFHLRLALTLTSPARRDTAWADHCRCRQQVEAALPQLLGSRALTPQGRTLVNAMAAHHTRLKEHAPPDDHLARAAAYVETTRVIWRRQRA